MGGTLFQRIAEIVIPIVVMTVKNIRERSIGDSLERLGCACSCFEKCAIPSFSVSICFEHEEGGISE
jgi:hypothetical protein